MLEARDITVSFGGITVLHGVAFEALPGQVTAVIGPNGSGKTTLLAALTGEVRHGGSVHINGRNLAELRPAAAAAVRAVLPQASHLLFPFTVREVVTLGVEAAGSLSREERRRLPEAALERVGLGGFGGRHYGDLSGGEQQRVQLARVLCQVWHPVVDGTPRYLLLDEPVASLDIRHQLQVMEIARGFADAGGGVVAIMHDLNLTAMFADSVVAMCRGRVAASGSPREVLAAPVLNRVFDCPLRPGEAPPHLPFVLPQSVAAAPPAS